MAAIVSAMQMAFVENLRQDLDAVARAVGMAAEVAGIAVIVFGAIVATAAFLRRMVREGAFEGAYGSYRRSLARAILLGLEFLVAADIIGTVFVAPTFRNLGVLALLVAVRTFLSFTLTVEVEGRWPWQSRGSRAGPGGEAG